MVTLTQLKNYDIHGLVRKVHFRLNLVQDMLATPYEDTLDKSIEGRLRRLEAQLACGDVPTMGGGNPHAGCCRNCGSEIDIKTEEPVIEEV